MVIVDTRHARPITVAENWVTTKPSTEREVSYSTITAVRFAVVAVINYIKIIHNNQLCEYFICF